ncbi:hypothetical protein H5410_003790 [Solanum commersonii]|uniref:Uncharacterized protein n=1 Tax=Solanum commersonii TaxID=4109 RepID=A0A9J6B5X4_SOLCO|nr:hypothetical protein H5410_003790 [Solanum commersonii]
MSTMMLLSNRLRWGGPIQPPIVPDNTLMLQELIVKLLVRLDSAPGIRSGTTCSPITVGATYLVQGSSVGCQTPGPLWYL